MGTRPVSAGPVAASQGLDGVVRVVASGPLRPASAVALRSVGMKWLAQEPAGMVIDLSAVSAFDREAVTVLATLAQGAAWWPGIRVAVHSTGPALRACMDRLGMGRLLVIAADEAGAVAAVLAAAKPLVWVSIDPRSGVRHAQSALAGFFASNDLASDDDVAAQVLSALVGTAACTGPGPYRLSIRLTDRYLQLAVRDSGSTMVRVAQPREGEGREVVARLAMSWGTNYSAGDTVTWASLPRPRSTSAHGPGA